MPLPESHAAPSNFHRFSKVSILLFVAAAQSCAPISVFVKQVFSAPLLIVLFRGEGKG